MMKTLCLLFILVQTISAVDIIRLTKRASCSPSAAVDTDTYYLDGVCEVKNTYSSTRLTVKNGILFTERFANSVCSGKALLTLKRNSTCDNTGLSFSVVSDLSSISYKSLVTVDDCVHMKKIVVQPKVSCVGQTIGFCTKNNTVLYCGSDNPTLFKALVTSSSTLISGIIQIRKCYDDSFTSFQVNGGCHQQSRTYLIGNATTIDTYNNIYCNGTYTTTREPVYSNCNSRNDYAYDVISALPVLNDNEKVDVYTSKPAYNTCGNVEFVTYRRRSGCPSSRGECTNIDGSLYGFVFCGADSDIWMGPFLQSKEIGSETKKRQIA